MTRIRLCAWVYSTPLFGTTDEYRVCLLWFSVTVGCCLHWIDSCIEMLYIGKKMPSLLSRIQEKCTGVGVSSSTPTPRTSDAIAWRIFVDCNHGKLSPSYIASAGFRFLGVRIFVSEFPHWLNSFVDLKSLIMSDTWKKISRTMFKFGLELYFCNDEMIT